MEECPTSASRLPRNCILSLAIAWSFVVPNKPPKSIRTGELQKDHAEFQKDSF